MDKLKLLEIEAEMISDRNEYISRQRDKQTKDLEKAIEQLIDITDSHLFYYVHVMFFEIINGFTQAFL